MNNFWKILGACGVIGICFIWYKIDHINIKANYTTNNAKTEKIIQQIAGEDKVQSVYKERAVVDSSVSQYLMETANNLQSQMMEIRKQNDLVKERQSCDTVIYTLREVIRIKDSSYYNLYAAYMLRGQMLEQKDTLIKISNDQVAILESEVSKNKKGKLRNLLIGIGVGVTTAIIIEKTQK